MPARVTSMTAHFSTAMHM
uniref:Uncharacterized protein n=1 Tax=Anguilla anguilla TaxID=7936 RepID=A0A0E9TMC3_ANGAN